MMKIIAILSLLAVGSCGTDNDSDGSSSSAATCESQVTGVWNGIDVEDAIRLGTDETFEYTGADQCKTSGTYSCPGDVATGSLTVTIKVAEASTNCLSAGDYVCPFAINDGLLSFYCSNDTGSGPERSYRK